MDVPQRTGAAEAREGEAPGAEAFRDIAGAVDAHEEEGNAARLGALQRGHAMRGLLEAGAEAMADDLDIVALGFAGGEKLAIGHQHGGGEIVHQADPGQTARGIALEGLAHDLVDQVLIIQPRDQHRDLEAPAGHVQQFRQQQFLAMRVIAAQRARHDRGRQPPHPDVMRAEQPVQRRPRFVAIEAMLLGQPLGHAVERVGIVAMLIEPVAHLLDRLCDLRQCLDLVAVGQRVLVDLPAHHRIAKPALQLHQRSGDPGRGLQHRLDLGPADALGFQRGVFQHRLEIGGKLAVGAGRKLGHVQVIDLRQPHQQLRRGRPLIRFDQRDIAGRDAKLFGHLRLRQPQRGAQNLQPLADDQLFAAWRHVTILTLQT